MSPFLSTLFTPHPWQKRCSEKVDGDKKKITLHPASFPLLFFLVQRRVKGEGCLLFAGVDRETTSSKKKLTSNGARSRLTVFFLCKFTLPKGDSCNSFSTNERGTLKLKERGRSRSSWKRRREGKGKKEDEEKEKKDRKGDESEKEREADEMAMWGSGSSKPIKDGLGLVFFPSCLGMVTGCYFGQFKGLVPVLVR